MGLTFPNELRLALPVHAAEEEHRLTVRVWDGDGNEYERRTVFVVEQLSLDFAGSTENRVRGVINLRAVTGLGPDEAITETRLAVTPVQASGEAESVIFTRAKHFRRSDRHSRVGGRTVRFGPYRSYGQGTLA